MPQVGPEGPLVHIGAIVGSTLTMGAKKLIISPNRYIKLQWKVPARAI